ncbi:MAG: ketopantoate reductase family protein [Candidatus Izemoplasmatales bacterium]
MKVCIYGAGAMGTVFGAYIAETVDVDLVSRNRAHIEALKKNGAVIIGETNKNIPVSALLVDEMKEPYDIIFLMTKQLENESVVKSLVPFLKEDGVICTMQNGLPEHSVSKVIGEERTLGCAMAWGATLHEGGVVQLTTKDSYDTLTFSLGSFSELKHPLFDEVYRILSLMGKTTVEENWIGARYAKLMINSAFSGLSVVLDLTFGEIAKDKQTRKYAQAILKECIDVAKQGHIKIEKIQGKDAVKLLDYHSKFKKWISYQIIPIAMKKHQMIKSSMLQDLERGRKCEIHAINGVVSSFGKEFGYPTPWNDQIVKIVEGFERKENRPGLHNLKILESWASL